MDYILLILGTLITLGAQGFINICYKKYRDVGNAASIKGADMARYILDKHGMYNVKVECVSGTLTDHYDPRTKVVRLSEDIYERTSIAAISVAAHECGHAIQDHEGFFLLRIRSMLVPIVNIASYLGYIAITIGLLASLVNVVWIGIYAELAIVLFQLVTLPVEIDASRRGLKELKENHAIKDDEHRSSFIMLVAAASTYLASVATALLQVLRLLLLVRNRD